MFDLRQSKYRFKWILVISLLAIGFATLYLATQVRTIASVDHNNGTRLRVVQSYDAFIFWDTSIYFDDGTGNWRWYYFEHEDTIRWRARVQIEKDIVRVSWNDCEIKFDTTNGDCTTRHASKVRKFNKSTTVKKLPQRRF